MAEKTQYERVKEITRQLEQGIEKFKDSNEFKNWLDVLSRFHDYSLNNTLLIYSQRPDCQFVAGYQSWKKNFGRQVVKGAKAIKILAPAPYKKKMMVEVVDPVTGRPKIGKDGETVKQEKEVLVPSYRVVNVFDYADTEGRELPSIHVHELTGEVEQYENFLQALKDTCPVPIGFEKIEGGARGYFHLYENRIAIKEGMSQAQTIKTLLHEMSHQRCHSIQPDGKPTDPDRPELSRAGMETEAEAVSYVVCRYYNLVENPESYSIPYISSWSQGKGTPELKASLERIRQAASGLITDINGNLKKMQLVKENAKLIDEPVIKQTQGRGR